MEHEEKKEKSSIRKFLRIVMITLAVLFILLAFFWIKAYFIYNDQFKDETAVMYKIANNDTSNFSFLKKSLIRDNPANLPNSLAHKKDSLAVEKWMSQSNLSYDDPMIKTYMRKIVNDPALFGVYKGILAENTSLKQQLADCQGNKAVRKPSKLRSSKPKAKPAKHSKNSSNSFFNQYFTRGQVSRTTELVGEQDGSSRHFAEAGFTWAKLVVSEKQRVYNESVVNLTVTGIQSLPDNGTAAVAVGSVVSGTARVDPGRGRVYISFNPPYEGEVYSLDNSRGIKVLVHGGSSLAEGIKRELESQLRVVDPTLSGVSSEVVRGTDVGRDFYANIEAGTMILAKIKSRR